MGLTLSDPENMCQGNLRCIWEMANKKTKILVFNKVNAAIDKCNIELPKRKRNRSLPKIGETLRLVQEHLDRKKYY